MSNGIRPVLFLTLLIALLLFRQLGEAFGWHHFQPYIALFFALSALRQWQWVTLPLVAYLASTLYAVGGFQVWMLSPLLAFGLIVVWGKCFSNQSGVPSLLGGSLAGAGMFYLVTNTISWLTTGAYAKSFLGFTQALWTGLPGYAPTWTFFRNDAVATVLFTAMILVLNRMTFGKRPEVIQALEA